MKKTVTATALVVLSTIVQAQETLQNSGNIQLHSGAQLGVFGDFTNNGSFASNASSELNMAGSTTQTINGSNVVNTYDFVVQNNDGAHVDNQVEVGHIMKFVAGKVTSDRADAATEFVHFLDGSGYSGDNEFRYIDGVVRKTGADAFTFPVGQEDRQTVGITAPENATDHFTAYYLRNDASDDGYDRTQKEKGIAGINSCEYWMVNRTGGTSEVSATLKWDENSCDIPELERMIIAGWDGSLWMSNGQEFAFGDQLSGTIKSSMLLNEATNPITLAATPLKPNIPELFTPNGDGDNEAFVIPTINPTENLVLTIYNRWGTEVYHSDDYQNDWTGKSQSRFNIGGDDLPEGTYYYQVESGSESFTGFVYLKRQ